MIPNSVCGKTAEVAKMKDRNHKNKKQHVHLILPFLKSGQTRPSTRQIKAVNYQGARRRD
jgi:hypothetical protein